MLLPTSRFYGILAPKDDGFTKGSRGLQFYRMHPKEIELLDVPTIVGFTERLPKWWRFYETLPPLAILQSTEENTILKRHSRYTQFYIMSLLKKMIVLWDSPTIGNFTECFYRKEDGITKRSHQIQFYRMFPSKGCWIYKIFPLSMVLQNVPTKRKTILQAIPNVLRRHYITEENKITWNFILHGK